MFLFDSMSILPPIYIGKIVIDVLLLIILMSLMSQMNLKEWLHMS